MSAGIKWVMVNVGDPDGNQAAIDLLAKAQTGDAEAFSLLVEPGQAILLQQAFALSGNLTTAEDLVSETLVAAWNSLPRYNQSCRLSTWLYSILLHHHRKQLRHARSRPISLSRFSWFQAGELRQQHENIPSQENSPALVADQNDAFAEIRRCLKLLPEKHYDVICLRFFEDASLLEMAHVLDCSVGTVKSRLHHALEKLRKMKMNLPHPTRDKQI